MAILSGLPRRSVAVLAMYACIPSGLATEPDVLTESEIKAGFLYNFTKFVEWPPDAFAEAGSPIVLGVVGVNPFGNLLRDAAAGKTVKGRAVLAKQFDEEGNLRSCHILFVSPSEKKRTAEILGKLKGASVLTVGEGRGFTQAGGVIGFIVEGNKVRLLINLEAASEAGVKISAKIIALARLTGSEPKGRN